MDYLQKLNANTPAYWWHDSADVQELLCALQRGASGITTNPVLISQALNGKHALLSQNADYINAYKTTDERAFAIIETITKELSPHLLAAFKQSGGESGYVCAQVNPNYSFDTERMVEEALRINSWAENISVKIPATQAGLAAIEECAAQGICLTATVSFTVSQAIAIAQRYEAGRARAKQNGIEPRPCNAVIMVGRQDDYLRDIACDSHANIAEDDIIQSGTAVIKRAYRIFEEKGYLAQLMPAGMRGAYHTQDLCGAKMRMSIHPRIQQMILQNGDIFEERIDSEVSAKTLKALSTLPEFTRAYEPDGILPEEFISYGLFQRTLTGFIDAWAVIAGFSF